MQQDEPATSPELSAVAAPRRLVRLDAPRPRAVAPPQEKPVATEAVPAVEAGGQRLEESVVSPVPTEVTAPRRAVRLVAKKVLSEEEKLAARQERKERERVEAEAAQRTALEKKLAALHDAGDMLQVMDTELALRRAQRLQGDGGDSRQALRVLSIAALFALLIAALGAMSWMQDRLAKTGFSRHRVEVQGQK